VNVLSLLLFRTGPPLALGCAIVAVSFTSRLASIDAGGKNAVKEKVLLKRNLKWLQSRQVPRQSRMPDNEQSYKWMT
jgi:hypothetical protein